jgi:dynein light intermediate chain
MQIKQLHMERSELEQQVDALKAKCEEIETKEAQRRAAEEEKHAEEVGDLAVLRDPTYSHL